jgi:hypothetical protein
MTLEPTNYADRQTKEQNERGGEPSAKSFRATPAIDVQDQHEKESEIEEELENFF